MKLQTQPHSPLTLGEFITSVYDACAASKAAAIVRLALETQKVLLRGNPPPVWQPQRSPATTHRPKPIAHRPPVPSSPP